MKRIGELDVRDLTPLPRWAASVVFALLCIVAFVGLRLLVDLPFPGVAPFALAFPVILVATLFGGPVGGWLTWAGTMLWAWCYGLAPAGSLLLEHSGDAPRLVLNALAGALILIVTRAFRDSAAEVRMARDAQLAERALFLRELEHRVANNFAIVAAVLRLHSRRAESASSSETLDHLIARIDGIARSHRHLYAAGDFSDEVDLRQYLSGLCESLTEGLLAQTPVQLILHADHVLVTRDRAVMIGVIVNELVTNAAKHAFPEGSAGEIRVELRQSLAGMVLSVQDNGRGIPSGASNGIGRPLLDDLVRQASASVTLHSEPGQGVHYIIAF